jgi:hypothetical protein
VETTFFFFAAGSVGSLDMTILSLAAVSIGLPGRQFRLECRLSFLST